MAFENIQDALLQLQRNLENFFFPSRCAYCGTPLGRATECLACRDTLPVFDKLLHGAEGMRITAPLYYEGRVREAILAFKFRGRLGGLRQFGAQMAQCAADHYSGAFDAITWVPVSEKRLRKRGFDQSHYLAAAMCVDWHVMPQETLRKCRDNPAQSHMSDASERRANVRGVYEAVAPEQIVGKRFLLIDDIYTTGATLGEAARVLRLAGARDVCCLTLAMTPEKRKVRRNHCADA